MDRIDDLINMHGEILRREEPIIIGKLKMINDLYPECEDSSEAIFFNEIINNFADIIQLQQEIIDDLRMEVESINSGNTGAISKGFFRTFIACPTQPNDGFETDEQMQAAFAYYLTYQNEKQLSSYTINDYCSRIRNLWKSFYKAYKDGVLPDELCIEDTISLENPLINVYNHIDELNCYVGMMSAASNEKRNWANTNAALNKFVEFINSKKDI